MRVKVRFKLNEQEAESILMVAQALQLDLDTFAKKALIRTVNELINRMEEQQMAAAEQGGGEADSDETQLTGGKSE
jgi:hypothetical protein